MTSLLGSRAFRILGAVVSVTLVGVFAWSLLWSDEGPRWSVLVVPTLYVTGLLAPKAERIGPLEPLVIGILGMGGVGLALVSLIGHMANGKIDGATALIFLLMFAFFSCLAWFGFGAWWMVRSSQRRGSRPTAWCNWG